MPIRHSSSMVQACRITVWPTVTRAPMTSGPPAGLAGVRCDTCSTLLSWILLAQPMTIELTSPRITAPGHTEASDSRLTSPITVARGCTQAPAAIFGCTPR